MCALVAAWWPCHAIGINYDTFASPGHVEMPLLAKHTYWSYLGRTCSLCKQGCLLHEPALLTCTGSNCSGAKVRKVASPCIARTWADNFASNAIQKRRTMTKSWNICWYALCAWRVCTKFVPSSTSIMTLNPITCAPLLWDEMWTSKKGYRTHCKEDEVGMICEFSMWYRHWVERRHGQCNIELRQRPWNSSLITYRGESSGMQSNTRLSKCRKDCEWLHHF